MESGTICSYQTIRDRGCGKARFHNIRKEGKGKLSEVEAHSELCQISMECFGKIVNSGNACFLWVNSIRISRNN